MRLSYDDGKLESNFAGVSVAGLWNRRGLDAESFGDWEGSFSCRAVWDVSEDAVASDDGMTFEASGGGMEPCSGRRERGG